MENGTPVTMLQWIDGCTLDRVEVTEEICFELGVMIAELHSSLKGLQTEIIKNTLNCIEKYLSDSGKKTLVHSDLCKSNLIYKNGKIIPIDILFYGVCMPEMDLASVFSHMNNESLNNGILNGYTTVTGNSVDFI